ncbi:hypothetical protein FISHEDRAFT_68418 [Fistulina hepatica ATCC 64428]|uniref:Uncharacterized protein n=1 Tax=Fistulina hepatica ATCC 64428 TaxID=1128425 RepID=A0A0D7ASR0_9AGAR|nr:hypothetical protein FISHEDRAFT_68418 [Fistulina hepatica ATCC 64428]
MSAPRPIPDMRFEPRYLSTIAPFVRVRHTSPTADQEKSSADAAGALQKSVELDIQWSQVAWVTLRDQFMFPFLQGLAIALVAVLQVSLHPLFVIASSITEASPWSVESDTPVQFNPSASTAVIHARLSSRNMPPLTSLQNVSSSTSRMRSAASSTFTSATAPSFRENLDGDLTVLKALNTRTVKRVLSRLPNAAPTTICDNAAVARAARDMEDALSLYDVSHVHEEKCPHFQRNPVTHQPEGLPGSTVQLDLSSAYLSPSGGSALREATPLRDHVDGISRSPRNQTTSTLDSSSTYTHLVPATGRFAIFRI